MTELNELRAAAEADAERAKGHAERTAEIAAEAPPRSKSPKEFTGAELAENPVLAQFGYVHLEGVAVPLSRMYVTLASTILTHLAPSEDRTTALHKLNSSRLAMLRAMTNVPVKG